MNIWDWIHQFEQEALARGDRERIRLSQVHSQAYTYRQVDPDRMLALLEDGRRLALRLHESWWVLFFDHWILETLIYYKDDYRDVIDLAVRLTLELRKPIYEQFPLRFGVWCNLVAAYLCVDPRGYRQPIQEALDYLGTQVLAEGGDRYLLQARRHWFAYELGELPLAHQLALEELAMADSDPDRYTAQHHEVDTYKALCWIAYRQKNWHQLAHYAATGEERARAISYRYELALFLLWRAVCTRREGRHDDAKRLCRQGTSQMARLGQPPGESYYDALTEYHQLGENLAAAWLVRERELETTRGKGQLAYECQVHIKRVQLLRRMGEPLEEEARQAEQAARRLRDPSWYLEELRKAMQ